MSTPDQRARDKDRNAAIEVVQAAWADGQIVEADRDKRVEELQRAQTLGEVQMLVHDLEPPTPDPAPVVAYGSVPYAGTAPAAESEDESPSTPEDTRAVPEVKYGPAFEPDDPRVAAAWRGRSSKARFLVPLVAVVVGAILVVGLITAVTSGGDGSGSSGGGLGGVLGGSEQKADVLSVAGYQDLLAAVREEAGSTTAFMAVLYPTYAVVELPVDQTTQHEEYWYWDGHDLTNNGVKSSSSGERTDLADIDPQVIVALVQKVRRKLPDATSYYAVVRAPDEDRAVVWAYATNEYGDSAYLGARGDGTITWDSTEH